MKKLAFLAAAFCFFSASVFGQKGQQKGLLKMQKAAYQTAMSNGDMTTAIVSANAVAAIEGPATTFFDTLARLYFAQNRHASSLLAIEKAMKNKPDDLSLLDIKARSLSAQEMIYDAIDVYQKLFDRTKATGYGFSLARLQFTGKRMAEAAMTIEDALALPDSSGGQPIRVSESGSGATGNQLVPIRAALHNLRGLVVYDTNPKSNEKAAIGSFDEAIRLFPEYVLAKQNRRALEMTQAAASAAAAKKEEAAPPIQPSEN